LANLLVGSSFDSEQVDSESLEVLATKLGHDSRSYFFSSFGEGKKRSIFHLKKIVFKIITHITKEKQS
jgi:hypothetical protein